MCFNFFSLYSSRYASSAITIKISVITAGFKKYKSIIKEKKKKRDKIVVLAKTKLNTVEVLISKALIDSNISHDEFISVNNVLKEYDDMKEEFSLVDVISQVLVLA